MYDEAKILLWSASVKLMLKASIILLRLCVFLREDGWDKDAEILLMQTLAVENALLGESDLQVAYMRFDTRFYVHTI